MKNKWSPVNPKHYEGKTMKQLQGELKEANEFAKKHPQFEVGWHNEYRSHLRKLIAEKIGRGK